jgi:hypothetical protein
LHNWSSILGYAGEYDPVFRIAIVLPP